MTKQIEAILNLSVTRIPGHEVTHFEVDDYGRGYVFVHRKVCSIAEPTHGYAEGVRIGPLGSTKTFYSSSFD